MWKGRPAALAWLSSFCSCSKVGGRRAVISKRARSAPRSCSSRLATARPADDVEQPDAALAGGRDRDEGDVGVGLDPHEGLHPQGDGRIGLGIAHQLPGNGRGFGNARGDLHPQVGQLFPHREPDGLGIHIGRQDLGIKLLAPLLQPRFDLVDLHPLNRVRPHQVVLHVPAQLFLLLWREGEFDVRLALKIGLT